MAMKKMNMSLFISVIILSLFGLLMVYSSSSVWAQYKFDDPFKYVKNQGFFLILGVILMYFTSKIDYKNIINMPIRFF
jgi:cell division protein FtsW